MIGSRLGIWVLDKQIGQGGAGTVYLAHAEPALSAGLHQAAIKVLAPVLAADPGFLGRFQREIEVLGKLDHPNIVKLYESGCENGHYYFAMEYVDGPSLEELRQTSSKLPWRDVLDLALQVAPALKHAHDRGIVHRDLKPANLLLAPDGVVKLTDFGIASLFASRHVTTAGAVLGTAEYLSPEQAAGGQVSPRSDLYSLGVVLYTLLTGRPLFRGDVLELLQRHRFAAFDRPVLLAPEIPGDLDALICQMLAKDPGQRPADAGLLARQLMGLKRRFDPRGGGPETGVPPPSTAIVDTGGPAQGAGPATLMSKLMRAELEDQKRGGPVRRFFNHPVVLIVSFLICVSLLAWGLWPLSADTMYRRGAALMESADPDEWYEGWTRYLEPLQKRYPDNGHASEIEEYRRRYQSYHAARRAVRLAERAGPMTEAQWFYQLGLRQRQQGDELAARRTWEALIQGFQDVASEKAWVEKAKQDLTEKVGKQPVERELEAVREAVRQAKQSKAAGKNQTAEQTLQSLRALYGQDRAARAIVDGE